MPCAGETRDASSAPFEVEMAVPRLVISSRVRGSLQKATVLVAVVCVGTAVFVNAGIGVNVADATMVGCTVNVCRGDGVAADRLHALSEKLAMIIKSVLFTLISFIK